MKLLFYLFIYVLHYLALAFQSKSYLGNPAQSQSIAVTSYFWHYEFILFYVNERLFWQKKKRLNEENGCKYPRQVNVAGS